MPHPSDTVANLGMYGRACCVRVCMRERYLWVLTRFNALSLRAYRCVHGRASLCVCVCACTCVRACMRACVRACVRA